MPRQPPVIAPVIEGTVRPLWSVMIPAYNCANYLVQTLQSVLVQDLGADQMQIEVVDDASTDVDVERLVAEQGGGRVAYFRQPQNVGNLRNFETCLNRSKGHLVHLLHGDDLVYPGYYEKIGALFKRFPKSGAAFSRFRFVTGVGEGFLQDAEASVDGILDNWAQRLGSKQTIQYCALSVRREVYERLGGFYGVTYAEDWEMWMRIAHLYPFAYTPEVLAAYRLHESSISSRAYTNAQNLRDVQWVIGQIQKYLPPSEKVGVRKAALRHFANLGYATARTAWIAHGDRKVALAQLREAVRMHRDPELIVRVLKLMAKMILNVRR